MPFKEIKIFAHYAICILWKHIQINRNTLNTLKLLPEDEGKESGM